MEQHEVVGFIGGELGGIRSQIGVVPRT
jgi:hypothetical protein